MKLGTTNLVLIGGVIAVSLGYGGIAIASMTSAKKQAAPGSVVCEVIEHRTSGGVSLEAVVSADKHVSGDYSFTVRGNGGGANIRQGGPFSVSAGETATLGQVMLSGSKFDARLSVTAGGATIPCDTTRL
jgi:hypothetical protein